MTEIELGPADFKLFRDLINKRSGIWLGDLKVNFLKIRLIHRMEACKVSTFKEYYYYLKYDPRGGDEIQNLIDAVSVNETHFFRDQAQIKSFRQVILTDLIASRRQNGRNRLKFWSAACATGEEAYTIAMTVFDVIKGTSMWDVEVLATDISNTALASARRGIYESYTLRETELGYVEKYFEPVGPNSYQVKNQLKQLVHFGHINLVDGAATQKITNVDCIFCRNIIMYLDPDSRRRVIDNMYRSLRAGGFLFLGEAESLHSVSALFEMRHFGRTIVYQKPGEAVTFREAG